MFEKNIDTMNIDQIINTAIYNEKIAYDHYRAVSQMLHKADNSLAGDFFADQANREKGHFNKLVRMKKRVAPNSISAVGDNIDFITHEGDGNVIPNINLSDAFKHVEDNEDGADQFYTKASQVTDDPETKKLFIELAEEEKHQYFLIQKARVRLEGKGVLEAIDYEDLGFQ